MSDELTVTDDAERRRYEVRVGSELAGFVDYHAQPGLITVLHTEVDPAFEGQGVGSRLVEGMLDDIRARGLRVLPICPFVRAYVRRHPEVRDLVAAGGELTAIERGPGGGEAVQRPRERDDAQHGDRLEREEDEGVCVHARQNRPPATLGHRGRPRSALRETRNPSG